MSNDNLVDVEVENGKYRYVLSSEGKAKCYRYGEEWRDVVGDKFILCLAQRIQELEEWQAAREQGGEPEAYAVYWGGGDVELYEAPLPSFGDEPEAVTPLYTQPQIAGVPECLREHLERIVKLHNEKGVVLTADIDHLQGLLTTTPQPAGDIPEGWNLVPADHLPEEMESAAVAAAREYMERTGGNCMKTIYKALVDAAPQPPREQQEGSGHE